MKRISDWQLVALIISMGIGSAVASAQQQKTSISIHPLPPDLARAFETVDIVLARIADPLLSVSSALSRRDNGKNQQELNESLQTLAHRWAAIMTVSNGKASRCLRPLLYVYRDVGLGILHRFNHRGGTRTRAAPQHHRCSYRSGQRQYRIITRH
jgi:hypothetical protein